MALAAALLVKAEFSEEEWDRFKVSNLFYHSYIKVGDVYWKPGGVPFVRRYLVPAGNTGGFGTPDTLNPTPYTLNHIPYTLTPKP